MSLSREEFRRVLGEHNLAEIDRRTAMAKPEESHIQGVLKGTQLHARDVDIPQLSEPVGENTMEATRMKAREQPGASERGDHTQTDLFRSNDDREESDVRAPRRPSERVQTEGTAPRSIQDQMEQKFLRVNNHYYFFDQTLAFIDHGTSLTVKTENRAVIKDLVALVQERGWEELKVTGSESFRREVWKEAYGQGIAVNGYVPSTVELAAANGSRDAQRSESLGPKSPAPSSASTQSDTEQTTPQSSMRPPTPSTTVVEGTLVAHGEAPYKHHPDASPSFFIRLQDRRGTHHEFWGVRLREALEQSKTHVAVGDLVGVRQVGSKSVVITTYELDETGQRVEQHKPWHRNDWVVEKPEYFKDPAQLERDLADRQNRQQSTQGIGKPEPCQAEHTDGQRASNATHMEDAQRKADAVRNASLTREELQRNHPDLSAAVFQNLDAHDRFAEAFVKAGLIKKEDRSQVIASMRSHLADRIANGHTIHGLDSQMVNRTITNSVLRATEEIGRRPTPIQPDSVAERTRVPKPLSRDEAHVRA